MYVGAKLNRLDIRVRLSTLAVLLAIASPINAQEWQWAHQGEGLYSDDGKGIAFDAADNTLVTGSFGSGGGGTITFDPFTLSSAGDGDCHLVKYSPEGDVLWAHSGGGTRSDACSDIAVDAVGYIYISGGFGGQASPGETATFGTSTVVTAGNTDMLLVKYSPVGDVIWARSAGGTEKDYAYAHAVDAANNILVTGLYRGTATFGPFTLTSSGNKDIFLVKYSPDGNVLWAQSAGGIGGEWSYGIALSTSGELGIVGMLEETATFGPYTLESTGSTEEWDMFVAKHAPPVVANEPVIGPAEELELSAVYPNPFASAGRFTLAVPEAQHVTIEVLDLLGRQVALLHNAFLPANRAHSFVIEAGGLPSGIYTVRAKGEHFSAVRRIALVR